MLLLTVVIGIATAGGTQEGKTEKDGQVQIVYYTFTATPHHLEDLDTIIARFNEKEPDIKIKVEAVGYTDGKYFTRLESLIVGGTPPDVFELNYENFIKYASKGVLQPLGSMVAQDTDFSSDTYRGAAFGSFSYKNEQYALPATFSTSVLYYNKELFDAAGVDYPTDEWTWDDAIRAAKKLTDPEKGVWGLYSPIQFYEFFKKSAQNGGRFFSKDGSEAVLDSKENIEALQFMVDLIHKHKVMPAEELLGGVSNEDTFAAGKIAMLVSGIWMFQPFSEVDFPWDIVVEPGMKQKATHFFADGVAISSQTKHKEAAYKWIKFYTSSSAMADIRIEKNWELPAISDLSLVQDYLEQSPPDNREAVYKSLDNPIPIPVIANQNEMIDIVNQAIEKVEYQKASAAEALKEADRQVDALLSR